MIQKRYAVISCPNCKKSRIIEIFHKKTTCPNCRKIYEIRKLKLLFETDSQEEARKMIGILNARRDGRVEDFMLSFSD